jgi:RNA polymerase sigma factor (TIGR02999 family)
MIATDTELKTTAAPPRTNVMNDHDVPLTQLLALAAAGERGALDRVFEALYPDLRRIAHARLRAQGGVAHLDTTSLVHESFLRLVDVAELALTDRKHFFTYAAKTMRNIIIDFAREHLAERRGGGQAALHLDTQLANELPAADGDATLMRINDALLALEAVDPALAQIVEMRYFAGYSEIEVAELTGSSERTVRRQWEKARAFLLASLQE